MFLCFISTNNLLIIFTRFFLFSLTNIYIVRLWGFKTRSLIKYFLNQRVETYQSFMSRWACKPGLFVGSRPCHLLLNEFVPSSNVIRLWIKGKKVFMLCLSCADRNIDRALISRPQYGFYMIGRKLQHFFFFTLLDFFNLLGVFLVCIWCPWGAHYCAFLMKLITCKNKLIN